MEKRKTEVRGQFSTPIWIGKVGGHKAINEGLIEYIKKLKEKDPEGVKKSNTLGWHSLNFDLKDNTIKNFFSSIKPMLKEVSDDMRWDLKNFKIRVTGCWSIINQKFASNAGHIHANNLISSVYYIKTNNKSGKIIFDDPRPAATIKTAPYHSVGNWNQGNVTVEPQDGLLVMFPSYLVHHVQPNMSEEERIILSFNLDVEKN